MGRVIRTADYLYAVYVPGVNGGEAASADLYADDFLYDLRKDPNELENLVKDKCYREVKLDLRNQLLDWIRQAEGKTPVIVEEGMKNGSL